ncbi:Alpha/beta hydrolase fold-1 [Echria macrotheca]|uniref:Alpha/beta hydrolase fold-1 n=1 Tax=Echria macrotheca TaxID=438768 RepID=A0AAJ0BHL5_9PEZI|nr:Alpha/beta hydrolase fold-1 [Echria macrotheca]
MTLPTILIVPGAWHTPASYARLCAALQHHGYPVSIPRLPSADSTGPGALATDIAHVRSVATSLLASGQKLIVLMYSYGGQVGSSAVAGLGPGVLRLIYLCAFALPKTMSLFDQERESGLLGKLPFEAGEDGRARMKDPRGLMFGVGVEVEGGDEYLGTLVEWCNGSGIFEYGSGEAWREVPDVTYVVATEDEMVIPRRQWMMIDEMRAEGVNVNVVEVKTGHCPNWTAVDEVVEVVRGVKVE